MQLWIRLRFWKMLWMGLGALAIALLLAAAMLWLLSSQLKSKDQTIQSQQNQLSDLMNRLMSGDLQTYSMMTALQNTSGQSSTFDPYTSMSDGAQLARLRDIGYVSYDEATEPDGDDTDELREMFGMEDLNDDAERRQ